MGVMGGIWGVGEGGGDPYKGQIIGGGKTEK